MPNLVRHLTFAVIALLGGLFCAWPLQAQRLSGVTFDPARYQEVLRISPLSGAKSLEDMSMPKQVTLRPYCPPAGYQGSVSSCTAYAVGYGAMSIATAIREDNTDPARLARSAYSATFIHHQLTLSGKDCLLGGVMVEDVLRFLGEHGSCRYVDFDTTNDCTARPDTGLLLEAQRHRIRDYAAVLPVGADPQEVISRLRTLLFIKNPVIAVIRAYESFINPRAGETVWRRRSDETARHYHCVVVTGYNDDDQTFEILNSWGVQWGDKGFYKINYADMGDITEAAYVLYTDRLAPASDQTDMARPAGAPSLGAYALGGSAALVRATATGELSPPEVVARDAEAGCYRLTGPPFPLNTMYQLYNSGTGRGQYVYAFSCDANGLAEVQYPLPYFSALSPGPDASIAIPSEFSGFRLRWPGDELVGILYSDRDIPDIPIRVSRLNGTRRENLKEKMQDAFGDLLVKESPGNHVEYGPNALKANASIVGGGNAVVPILLWLRVE